MTSRARRGNVLLTVFVAAAAFGFGTGRAEAQWGGGFGGLRMGFRGGFSQVPKPESFVNQIALVDAARPSTAPTRARLREQSQFLHQPHPR